MLKLEKNYLQKYQQIYPQNPDWNSIEYKLQLNLGNASVQLKRVYSVINPYLSNQFQKDNKGYIPYQVYIKPQSLTGSNRIERVCQKGFQFNNYPGQNGMVFTIGQIQGITPNQKTQYQLLVVKICPKKSFPVIKSQQTLSQEYRIPQGFDSLCFKQNQDQDQIYRHRIRINRKSQTLPCYLIQFTFNNAHQQKFKKMVCAKCKDVVATYYCVTEKTYFCKKCDYEHHKDSISSKHERKPLNEKPILNFGFCANHPKNKNELFCRQCNQSMCINCKIYGSHSQGPMANHQLQKISDYFAQITTKLNQMDPNLQKRKDQLQQILALTDQKVKIINHVTSQIQQQLTKMFQDALKQLQIISRKKLSQLISDQLQIRRQYDYIQWMQSFLKYQFNVLPPNGFLASWTKHIKLRKEVLNISNIPAITDVRPNYSIYGKVRVLTQQKIKQFQQRRQSQYKYDLASTQARPNNKIVEPQRDNEDIKQNQSFFRKKLFQAASNENP